MGTLKVNGSIQSTGKLYVGSSPNDSTPPEAGIHVWDIRDGTITPNSFGDHNVNFYFKQEVNGDWKSIMHVKGWTGSYAAWQIAAQASNSASESNSLYFRTGINNSWNSWHTILDSSNWSNYCAPASHAHSYLPLAGGTMSSAAAIQFSGTAASIPTSTAMAITYGKIQTYGSLAIAADTDNSGNEYITLTAGKGLGGTADGLTIYQNHLTWLNYPLSTFTDVWIDASGLDQNTYYPVLCWVPQMGLHRFRLSVQLNGGGKPGWSTHNGGFTCNIDVMLNYAGWGTTSHLRYIKLQDDYNFATVKPAYFAGQGYTSSNVCFMVRGGGRYRFITDHPTTFSLKTSSTTVNNETFSPTTSTSVWYSGQYADIAANILGDASYATTAGCAARLGRSNDRGVPMTFWWDGQGGQPTWLWGGNDGTNMYVYNPSNFNVNYANSAGSASTATTASNLSSLPIGNGAQRITARGWYKVATISRYAGSTGPSSTILVLGKTYGYTNSETITILVSGTYCNVQFTPIGHASNYNDYTTIRATGTASAQSFDVEVYIDKPSSGNDYYCKVFALQGSATPLNYTAGSGSVIKSYTLQNTTQNGSFGYGNPDSGTSGYGEIGAIYYQI